jgi:hypothetical protein
MSLQDSHRIAEFSKIISARQTGRARANNSNLLFVLGLSFSPDHPVTAEFHGKSLQGTDSDRFIDLRAPTGIFTWMSAYVSTNGGKRIARPDDL